jgi:hypothetical protein
MLGAVRRFGSGRPARGSITHTPTGALMSDQTPNFEEFYGYKFEELSVGQSAVYARTVP